MGKAEKVQITQGQGNFLLLTASSFILPETLGETKYAVIDRSIAEQEVGALYKELKSRSPLLQKKGKDRAAVFGPTENLIERAEGGNKWWEINDVDQEVEISIDDDTRNGIFWCLLTSLHPASQRRLAASSQVETAWPLARRLGIEGELRKEMGLDKGSHRRLTLDVSRKEEEAG